MSAKTVEPNRWRKCTLHTLLFAASLGGVSITGTRLLSSDCVAISIVFGSTNGPTWNVFGGVRDEGKELARLTRSIEGIATNTVPWGTSRYDNHTEVHENIHTEVVLSSTTM